MRFAKGHGTGNDFVILVDPDGDQGLSPGLAARLCDRRAGIGADGVLRAVRATALAGAAGTGVPGTGSGTGATGNVPAAAGNGSAAGPEDGPAPEWFMDYRNSDGSPAEMCGNGLRVFARYLARRGLAAGPAFTVATRCGARRVRLEDDGSVTAEMGAVALLGPGRAVVGGVACEGMRVSVGNPHLACLVDAPLAGFDLARPPQLDPAQFPQGGNVELVRVTGPGLAQMRVYERGSGETRSCGTGAVAAAAAAAAAAGQDHGSWRVSVPGGQLTVVLEPAAAWLGGPAVIVAEGELDEAWLAAAVAATS
ncbi:MAG TPA: diaminopimelate epimerase [Streptosporangiaceae bacterium]|nr:diaminopimelate epimerase [Streptosporangiaceae bacterium]